MSNYGIDKISNFIKESWHLSLEFINHFAECRHAYINLHNLNYPYITPRGWFLWLVRNSVS
jgi:hypothetical protein